MGRILSKRKISNQYLRDLSGNKKSSCGLDDYWNEKEQDFQKNFFNNNKSPLARASDFRITTLLDEGAFGSVALTTHNKTGTIFATKVIAKKKIVKNELVSF